MIPPSPYQVERDFFLDQGTTWRYGDTLSPQIEPVSFAGASAKLDVRIVATSAEPDLSISTVPNSSGFVGLDTQGDYWWIVYPAALAELPVGVSMEYCLRVFWADGVNTDDLVSGRLFLSQNLVTP
jgi:hypothetical protein